MGRKALGKGLGALIPTEEGVKTCPVEDLRPGRYQPRRAFGEEGLEELARSVKEKGIIQPIVVRKAGDGYEIIAGERRWRAALKAGLKEVPIQLVDADDRESLELALVENIQRENLNPIEEAEAYKRLVEEFGYSHEEVALRVGKDRATVSNTLRLLKLPVEVREEILRGGISAGHARAILSLPTPSLQIEACRRIMKGGLSVREAERLVKRMAEGGRTGEKRSIPPEIRDLEDELKRALATKVEVKMGRRKGRLVIEFYSLEDLDRIINRLRGA